MGGWYSNSKKSWILARAAIAMAVAAAFGLWQQVSQSTWISMIAVAVILTGLALVRNALHESRNENRKTDRRLDR